jgi:hypothetical protein
MRHNNLREQLTPFAFTFHLRHLAHTYCLDINFTFICNLVYKNISLFFKILLLFDYFNGLSMKAAHHTIAIFWFALFCMVSSQQHDLQSAATYTSARPPPISKPEIESNHNTVITELDEISNNGKTERLVIK